MNWFYAFFFAGNLQSLKIRPAEKGLDLYEHLRQFHNRAYSSHYMTLAVQSRGMYEIWPWNMYWSYQITLVAILIVFVLHILYRKHWHIGRVGFGYFWSYSTQVSFYFAKYVVIPSVLGWHCSIHFCGLCYILPKQIMIPNSCSFILQ